MAGKNVFDEALAAEGISGRLAEVARSIYEQESSRGRNTRTSNAGAVGGMQIIPSTFASVADKDWDITDPLHNARAGLRYLKQLDKQAGGDPALTAAGYYGGPGGLEKARRGIAVSDPRNPNAPNTLEYGQQVARRLGRGTKTEVPEPVLAAAPAQLAQATVPAIQAQAVPVATPIVQPQVQGPDEWTRFREQMAAKEEQPMELNYGPGVAPVARFNPVVLPTQRVEPNFAAFNRWQSRIA